MSHPPTDAGGNESDGGNGDRGNDGEGGFAERAFDLLAARPAVTVAAMLAGAVLGGWAAAGAEVDFSPQSVLDGRDALVAEMEAARRTFGYEDAVLLVLLRDDRPRIPGEDAPGVLSAAALDWQRRLAGALPALPHVTGAVGVTTLKTGRAGFPLGRPVVTPLVPGTAAAPTTAEEAAWVREQLSDGRADGLVSGDRRTAAVLAPLDPAARTADKTRAAVAAVRDYLSKNPPPGGLTAAVGGMPALRLAIIDGLGADTALLFPLSGVLFLAAVALAFRRPVGLLVPGLGVGCGLAWAAGLLAAAGSRFGILSNVLPVLLTVVGLAAAVHLLSRYAEEAGRGGDETDGGRRRAARRAFRALLPATALTLGTTAVGFGSLLTAGSDAVRAFAVQACAGLGCLGVSTLAAFAALAPRLRPPREPGGHAFHPADMLGGWATRRPAAALAGGAAVAAAGAWCGAGLKVESRMLETHDAAHPAAAAVRRIERDLGGVIAVEVILAADRPGRLLDPAVYEKVDAFAAAARRVPGVLSVRTYTDSLNRTAAGIRRSPGPPFPPPFSGPADPAAAGRIRRARAFLERVTPGALAPFLTPDAARGRALVRVADVGTAATLELAEELKAELNRRFPPDAENPVRWSLTGDGYVNAVGMDRFVRDFLRGLAGAVVIIFAAVALLFRGARAGLIAAGVNLAPLCATLVWLRLRGLELNAGNAIVFAVGLGVAVDDTVHLLARFREELKIGTHPGPAAAARATVAASGRAVALTTGLVACGVAVLLFSEFVPTRRFAELVCVTLTAALLADLTLLPAALARFWPRPVADGRMSDVMRTNERN